MGCGMNGMASTTTNYRERQLHSRSHTLGRRLDTSLCRDVLEQETIDKLPGFRKRMDWFLANRKDLFQSISWLEPMALAITRIVCWPFHRKTGY